MKINTRTVHSIDYSDLEEEARDVYGVAISIPAALESGNDVTYEFLVNGVLDEWDQQSLDEWKAGGEAWYSTVVAILDDLARQGRIPTGDYTLRVSW